MSELARLANSTKLRKQENGLKMKVDLEMVLKVEVEVQKTKIGILFNSKKI